MRRSAILLTALVAGCATPTEPVRPLAGRWGGQHVALALSGAQGRLDYDCAAGTIDQPLVARADGRFSASGTHTPGHGGPDRVGEVPRAYPARYSGTVRGDAMTLVVDVVGLAARLGPYRLRRGAQANLMRCL